jgi:hypothetical protein
MLSAPGVVLINPKFPHDVGDHDPCLFLFWRGITDMDRIARRSVEIQAFTPRRTNEGI